MKKMNRVARLYYLYIIIVIAMVFLLTDFLFQYYLDAHYKAHLEELDSHAQKSAQLIQESIMRKIYVVDTLRIILELTDYDVSKFQEWAPYIFESEQGIACIQLAPSGIISNIYPLEGNEEAIGYHLIEDENPSDAKWAIEPQALTFRGPTTLVQHDKKSIVSTGPIFIEKNLEKAFWGFSIVVFDMEDVGFSHFIDDEVYNYRILNQSQDQENTSVIYESDNYSDELQAESNILVPGGQWTIQMSFKKMDNFKLIRATFYSLGLLSAGLFIVISIKKRNQALEIQKLNEELKRISLEDELTGCHNRRYFESIAMREQKRVTRYNARTSAIMLDIDFFKDVNDQYGHHVGDLVLKELAKIMMENIRTSDDLARWGGEEFIILLPNTGGEEAVKVAEKLREKIEKKLFERELKITASFGVTEYIPSESYDSLFKRVDSAVYMAKERGRNQVVLK
ncbi:sensor domain-containing diguanylate cyclase [Fusibacter ferrireducens]|uniref:Sensor domain-containing diguanylate cyclase n=1 Tax=Fusibacter ferrireducens TaxID=2785058 RepID=A0ABR9ZTB2_9FIRM|nr:diguanylate cyclase [Fusibacter ferrireducens]MBF4693378.1 sensor domain-containing diguanylate cyclase [Fusibacter ferrireducens]